MVELNRYNIINVRHNNRGFIKINLYETLHNKENEIKLYIYDNNARDYIYEQFICVIKHHYISNSDITFSDIEQEEEILNSANHLYEDNLTINSEDSNIQISNNNSYSNLLHSYTLQEIN